MALEDVSSNFLSWNNSGSNNGGKTAAEWCSAWNESTSPKKVTGGTWRLPTIKDWQYMFIGCGASDSYSDNPSTMSFGGLATKLSTAGGTALDRAFYWSGTECSPGVTAWRVDFGSGDSSAYFTDGDYEEYYRLVRACLAF